MNSGNLSLKQKMIALLPLLIISLIAVIALTVTHYFSKDKIKENKERAVLAIINEVISVEYNNDLLLDKVAIAVPTKINPSGTLTVYRAKKNNQAVAVSLLPIITKGYNGDIHLVIGISYDGKIIGVNILQHQETEGFGAKAHQANSNWLRHFYHYSLETPKEKWVVKKDRHELDQLSGATITANSITRIIYEVLEYYVEKRELFYETKP